LDFTIVLVLWYREFYCWKGCHVLFCGLNCVCSNSHELQITCNKKTMPFEGNVYISQRVLSRPLVDCCDRSFYSAILIQVTACYIPPVVVSWSVVRAPVVLSPPALVPGGRCVSTCHHRPLSVAPVPPSHPTVVCIDRL
jgi:hypothetical protein